MGDLISRKAVITAIHDYFKELIDREVYTIETVDCSAILSKYIIQDIPTTYDVDKVVEQIEIEAEFVKSDKDNAYGAYKLAIGIIKEGAVKDE